jgi:cyanophycinase
LSAEAGNVALHGGGEFLPGDEPFLGAILEAARATAGNEPVRAVVVPVAAARGRPELAARHGVEALRRVADDAAIRIAVEAVLVVDATTANEPGHVAALRAAHLIHLPGGDPDLVPGILAGSEAWRAILAAHAGGAVVAGASAGAMGLAGATWTPHGFVSGLGLVPGVVVVPHYETFDRRGRDADIAHVAAERLAVVGLDERTGVIREARGRWRVAGAGRAVLLPDGAEPLTGRHGDILPIDA